jgi:hypothetical protein
MAVSINKTEKCGSKRIQKLICSSAFESFFVILNGGTNKIIIGSVNK